LLHLSLAETRAQEVEQSGVEPTRLTFADYAFASAPLLSAFARQAPRGAPSALAISADSPIAGLAAVSSARRQDGLIVYDIFLDAFGQSLEELRAEAKPVRIDHASRIRRRPLPRLGPGPHHLELPDDGVLAAHLEHWCHFLWVAPLLVPLLLSRGGRRYRSPGAQSSSVLLGKKVNVHPRAYLEGSVIGDEVEIGSGCVVSRSFVGAQSRLADLSKLRGSVLGPGAITLVDTNLVEIVSLGGGTLANLLLRETILGRNVFLTTGVLFQTDALEGTIGVEHRGEWVDTGRRQLGGCVGHGAVLGARTIVAPGRALPNRVVVVMRKEEGVQRIPNLPAGTPVCWDRAALVPVSELNGGRTPEELLP
jgi:acetyltransferase-like isoleucine patch superfamily enzyme